jgi:lysophospholipid acyltransferase (LPLAT)-like uncharacterized protein
MKLKLFAHFIHLFIRLLSLTYRYQFIGLENKEAAKLINPQKAFIYALWHQNLIGAILSHLGEKFTMMISESDDGELVAITCANMGHIPVRGSSTRGGKRALLKIVKVIQEGIPGAISVDGPKGPTKIVKPGIIEVAKLSGCAIVPLSPYPKSFWYFSKSWDQFRVPKPFTKIAIIIGEPLSVAPDISKEDFEAIQISLKQKLIQGEEMAKRYFNLD